MEYLPRFLEEEIDKLIDRKEFLIVRGPRQSGKTTLIKHLSEKYGGVYFTLEDPAILDFFEKNPKEFVRSAGKNLIFIDEAQYSKNAGKNLKLIYDFFGEKIKIVVTGSGSFDVKSKVGGYLVGRCSYLELFPLSFGEFLLWKNSFLYKIFREMKKSIDSFITSGKTKVKKVIGFEDFYNYLEEFIIYGGFPKVVKEKEKKENLRNLTLTYLERDVGFFFNIFHLEKFRKLLNYLAINNGSQLELNKISRELSISFQTLQNYLSVLVNTYIIKLISPFYMNPTIELKKMKKFYFIDTGMRNFLIDDFRSLDKRSDKGFLYENFVLNEIVKNFGFEVKYWRTKRKEEVDFLVKVKGELIPIEVKSKPELTKSFIEFLEIYKPKKAIVFNENEWKVEKVEKTQVMYLPLIYF